jgi:nucleoside-diphosphate-sugar epimerase
LNTFDALEKHSKDAEIVINAGPDATHAAAIEVILKALSGREKKAYYIHTSGAASTWDAPDGSKPGEKIWDDVADLAELRALPDTVHKIEDQTAFSAVSDVNTAVISPTFVYGLSPSIDHPLPLTFEPILSAIKGVGQGFTISAGKNIQSFIHVVDQAKFYLILLSDAIKSLTTGEETNPSFWGPDAYYFGGDEELSFKDYMTALVKVLKSKGIIETEELKTIDVETAAKASGAEELGADSWGKEIAIMMGTDMRVRSTRGIGIGWKFEEPKVRDTLEDVVSRYLELKG